MTDIDEVDWPAIRPHLTRDAIIVIADQLDLAIIADQLARDDKTAIQKEIEAGRITKPSLENLKQWNESPSIRFRITIVQPYVLIQPVSN